MIAASAWVTTIFMSGLAAATIFPALKQLDPSIPSMSVLREMHWKILAGVPAQKIFVICQFTEYLFCGLSLIGAGLAGRGTNSLRLSLARWACHLLATALLVWIGARIITPLVGLFIAIRQAATNGDAATAMSLDAEFAVLHARATPLMGAMGILVLVTLFLAIRQWSPRATVIAPAHPQ